MDGRIKTYIVYGFLEAGKSSYILDCLKNDFFYKRGSTLLVLCEEGEVEFDRALLDARRVTAVVCASTEEIERAVIEYKPDRVYVEMNAFSPCELPSCLRVDFAVTIIDGETLGMYYANMRQQLMNMVSASHQVIFNRCEKESLEQYANAFRVMNRRASYLWEGPGGYHEKAFGVMVPFDLSKPHINLSEADFTPFCLDAMEAPQHYEGKTLTLICTVSEESGIIKAGRQVMTCCAADIQFLGFECRGLVPNTWQELTCRCTINKDRQLTLEAAEVRPCPAPARPVIGLQP